MRPPRVVGGIRDPWVIASLAAIAAVVIATPVVLVAMVIAQLGNSLSHIGERKHLKPIPISKSACPYVAFMHAAANNYQSNAPLFGIAFDANGHLVPWSRERPHLDATLQLLEGSIKAGTPHFPHPIRAQLAITQGAVHEGRLQLARSSNPGDLITRAQPAIDRGQRAFGFASDLVGHQCAVDLGADSSTMALPGFTTTTVSPPTSRP
jgi:hypothetical protein